MFARYFFLSFCHLVKLISQFFKLLFQINFKKQKKIKFKSKLNPEGYYSG